MPKIALTQGYYAIVDVEDLPIVCSHNWQVVKGPWNKYARANGGIYMHRLILNTPGDKYTDHINGNGLDNRRCNLRVCTASENAANGKSRQKRASKSSKYNGLSWQDSKTGGCWRAEVEKKINGKRKRFIKYSGNQSEAARLYNELAVRHFGEFAKLNEI